MIDNESVKSPAKLRSNVADEASFRLADDTAGIVLAGCNTPTKHYSLARAMSCRAHNRGSIINSPATVTDTAPARNSGAPEK